jgi:hypothetical protein
VPVRVHGMNVAAVIVEQKSISFAFLHREQRIGVGPRLAVDSPAVVAAAPAGDLLEG